MKKYNGIFKDIGIIVEFIDIVYIIYEYINWNEIYLFDELSY